MKHFIKISPMILALALVLFAACSDDEPDDIIIDVASEFEYDGNTYELDKGFILPMGKHSAIDRFELLVYLTSADITYDETTKSSFKGSGEILSFQFLSENEEELTEGSYLYAFEPDQTVESLNDTLSFTASLLLSDYDLENKIGTRNYAYGGEVHVSKNGDKTVISFNLETDDPEKSIAGNASLLLEKVDKIEL